MAQTNSNLHNAKDNKNDEFYTRFEDIENECEKYTNQFRDKVIYCNCDDPLQSNFFRYFAENFNIFGLKRLIATCYNKGLTNRYRQVSLFGEEWGETEVVHQTLGVKVCPNRAFKIEMNKGDVYDFNGDGRVNASDVIAIIKNDLETGANKLVSYLDGDGDFRSDECIEILRGCDIVVTNPPFSLFREFVATMEKYNKQYLVVGNTNAITYKEIFPLIKENKLWLGYNAVKEFIKPDGTTQKFGNICWFTNLDTFKRHEEFYFSPANEFTLEKYPLYDNYNAFNIDEVKSFPCEKKIKLTVNEERFNGLSDTYGDDLELLKEEDGNYTITIDRPIFGVPITFLDKYNPDEFEIVAFRKGKDGKDLVFTAERERESSTVLLSPCSTAKLGLITGAKHTICEDGKSRYGRIAIKRK